MPRRLRGSKLRRARAQAPAEPRGEVLRQIKIVRRVWAKLEDTIRAGVLERDPGARNDADRNEIQRKIREVMALPEVGDVLAEAGRRVQRHADRELGRIMPIPIRQRSGRLNALLEDFRHRNVHLITSLGEEVLGEVEDLVDDAARGQIRVEELRGQIEQRFGVGRSRADLIARDQILKHNGQVIATRQQELGIVEYVWIASRDERVRKRHRKLDGTIHRWDTPPETDARTGRTSHPGDDYQCRCAAKPIIPDDLDEVEAEGPEAERDREAEAKYEEALRRARERERRIERRASGFRVLARGMRRPLDDVEVDVGRQAQLRQRVRKMVERIGLTPSGLRKEDAVVVQDLPRGINGQHTWDGEMILAPHVVARARRAVEAISEGRTPDVRDLDGVRVIVHEEVHGYTPLRGEAYIREAAALEEIATEVVARDLIDPRRQILPPLGQGSYREYQRALGAALEDVEGLDLNEAWERILTLAEEWHRTDSASMDYVAARRWWRERLGPEVFERFEREVT